MNDQAQLYLIVNETCWWLAAPPDLPLDVQLQRFFGKKREIVASLLECRYPLSGELQERIRTHERHHSNYGFLCQLCLGICLPSGVLTGTNAWDYDRDMDVLRREVAAVLGRHLAPGEWELTEHIDSEAAWAGGKRLFILYLT